MGRPPDQPALLVTSSQRLTYTACCSIVKRTEMRVENLRYLLTHGQENMTVRQIADAFKEAHQLIEKAEKMEHLLKEIHLYETDSNDAWVTNVLKMIDEALRQ